MKVSCSPNWPEAVHIYKSIDDIPVTNPKRKYPSNGNLFVQRRKRETEMKNICSSTILPIVSKKLNGVTYYNTSVSNSF